MAKFQDQREIRLANKEAKNKFKKALDECTYLQLTKGDMPDITWKYCDAFSKSIDGASGGAYGGGLRSAGSQMLNKLELVDPFNDRRSFSLQTWQICIADPSTKKSVFYSKIKDSVKRVEEELHKAGFGTKFIFGCSGSKGLNALIAEMCSDAYQGAGLQIFDEFGEFLGIYEIQKKEAHLAFVLRLYNGDGIDQFFKTADNQFIDKTVISFYTFSQVYTVLKYHQLMDSGFVQRFVWIFAIDQLEFLDLEECVKIWNDMNGDNMSWNVFLSMFNKYNNRQQFDPEYDNKLHFNNETAKLLLKDIRDYFKKIRHQFKYKDNLLNELAGKAATQAEKLAVIDQVLENELILFETNPNKLFIIPSESVDVSTIEELNKFEVFPKNVLSATKTMIKSMLFAVRLFHEWEPDENTEYTDASNLACVQQLLFNDNAVICPNILNGKKIWHLGVPLPKKRIRLLSTNGTKILNVLCEYKLVKKFKICENWCIYLLVKLDNINNIEIIQKMFKIYQRHGINYGAIKSVKLNIAAIFENLKTKKETMLKAKNNHKIKQNKPPMSNEEMTSMISQFSTKVQSTLDSVKQFNDSAALRIEYCSQINDLSESGKNVYEICNPIKAAKFGASADLLDTTKKDISKYFPDVVMNDIKSISDIPAFQRRLHKLGATISAIQQGIVFSPSNDYIENLYTDVSGESVNWSLNESFDEEKGNDEPLAEMSNYQLGQLLQQEMICEIASPAKHDANNNINNNHNKNNVDSGMDSVELEFEESVIVCPGKQNDMAKDMNVINNNKNEKNNNANDNVELVVDSVELECEESPIGCQGKQNDMAMDMDIINNNKNENINEIDDIEIDMDSMELDSKASPIVCTDKQNGVELNINDMDKHNSVIVEGGIELDRNILSFIGKVQKLKIEIDNIMITPMESKDFEKLFERIEDDLCIDLLKLYKEEHSLVLDKLSSVAQSFETDTVSIARQLFIEYSSNYYEVFSIFVLYSKQNNMLPVENDLEYVIQMLSLCLNDNTNNDIKSLLYTQIKSKMTTDMARKILNYSYYRVYVGGDLSKKFIINWLKTGCKSGMDNINVSTLMNSLKVIKNDNDVLGKRTTRMTEIDDFNENNNKRLRLCDLDINLLQDFGIDNCIVINLREGPVEDLKKGKRIENRTKQLPHDINLVLIRSCKSEQIESTKICFVAVMEEVKYENAIQLDPDFTLKRYNNKNATNWWYMKELMQLDKMIQFPTFGAAYVYAKTYKKHWDLVLNVLSNMKLPAITHQMINKLSTENEK